MKKEPNILVSQLFADAMMHKVRSYQIADRAGLCKTSLSLWKTGKIGPTLEGYLKARDALDDLILEKE